MPGPSVVAQLPIQLWQTILEFRKDNFDTPFFLFLAALILLSFLVLHLLLKLLVFLTKLGSFLWTSAPTSICLNFDNSKRVNYNISASTYHFLSALSAFYYPMSSELLQRESIKMRRKIQSLVGDPSVRLARLSNNLSEIILICFRELIFMHRTHLMNMHVA